MWYDQNNALSSWRIPEVRQLLTTANIPLSQLWRKVWKRKTTIFNVLLDWAERQTAMVGRRRQNFPGRLSTAVTPTSACRILSSHPEVSSTCGEGSHTSVLASFLPLWQRTRERFFCPCKVQGSFLLLDAALLRRKMFSATPSRKIRRQCHSFLKCHPVSSTIVQSGSITFPSFLPVHSFPCLENC